MIKREVSGQVAGSSEDCLRQGFSIGMETAVQELVDSSPEAYRGKAAEMDVTEESNKAGAPESFKKGKDMKRCGTR